MSETDIETTAQTLGQFLKATREAANISLEEAQASTKISPSALTAMEEDDFECMPAEAFSRGFYVMYAKFLGLDHEQILERYLEVRGLPPLTGNFSSTPPVHKSGQFRNYAEAPSVSPMMNSVIATVTVLTLIVAGCWYSGWNPLRYVQDKISSLQGKEEVVQPPPSVPAMESNVPSAPAVAPVAPEPVNQPDEPADPTEQNTEDLSPATVLELEDTQSEEESLETSVSTPAAPKEETTIAPYKVEISFQSAGTLKASVDNGFMIDKHYQIGQTMEWEIQETILLELPETIEATILMNGITIPLPEVNDGLRRLSLPEDLLN